MNPVSSLLAQGLGTPPVAPASALVRAIGPIAETPSSRERIDQQSDAIRHRGLSRYA